MSMLKVHIKDVGTGGSGNGGAAISNPFDARIT